MLNAEGFRNRRSTYLASSSARFRSEARDVAVPTSPPASRLPAHPLRLRERVGARAGAPPPPPTPERKNISLSPHVRRASLFSSVHFFAFFFLFLRCVFFTSLLVDSLEKCFHFVSNTTRHFRVVLPRVGDQGALYERQYSHVSSVGRMQR